MEIGFFSRLMLTLLAVSIIVSVGLAIGLICFFLRVQGLFRSSVRVPEVARDGAGRPLRERL